MGQILGTIFAFSIVFGVLVFIHEFGHFFAAKLNKVKVEVFSWGYGKRLFGVKKGDTDYRVSIFPLGGFVKFSGEEAIGLERPLAPYDFLAKRRWQRFIIIFMGPLMNTVLAVVLFAFINLVGVTVPEYQDQAPVIGWIEPGSPAEQANLQIDDEILSINKRRTKIWSEVELAVGTKPEKLITLDIKRDDEVLAVELMTEKRTRYEMGYAGFFGKILTQVGVVIPGSPAEKGGMKPNDVILAINGELVYFYQFLEIIEKNAGNELVFLIDREGTTQTLRITPRLEGKVGKIGIGPVPKSIIKKYGLFAAVHQGFKESIRLTFLVINFLKDLITGQASARQLGGPIEIANISYAAFRMGFIAMISWIAIISLQLGIINLFPIPVLDGGHLLVLLLEGITRRDFSLKVKQIVMQIGFAIFILLIVFAILNDVTRRLPNGWESLLFWK
jgi:regulator of sigma E protease